MGFIKKLQLLLVLFLFTSNAWGAEAPHWFDEPQTPGGHLIVENKDYYHNKFKFDTTKPCTGVRCFNPGTAVYCSSYEYKKSGSDQFQFCNVSAFKPKDGVLTPVRAGRRITMVTGYIGLNSAGKPRFTPRVPTNKVIEWDIQGNLIPAQQPPPPPPPKPKPLPTPLPEPESKTEAVGDCNIEGCIPELGNATGLAADAKKATDALPAPRKKKPTPTINQVCNISQTGDACQLCNCYHESRGESFAGKIAVARTVLARLNNRSFPGSTSVCRVIFAPAQFSWTADRISNDIITSKPESVESFEDCKRALVIAKERGPGTAYFYNPDKAAPKWAKNMKICATIDNHRFVTPKSVSCPSNMAGMSISKPNNMRYSIVEDRK